MTLALYLKNHKTKIQWKFVYRYWAIKRFYKRTLYKIYGGYKCDDCSVIFKLYNYELTGKVQNTSMLFSNSCEGQYCPHCVYKRIEKYFNSNTPNEVRDYKSGKVYIGNCDFTKRKQVPVVDIIWGFDNKLDLNVRFGEGYWNGSSASLEAFRELLTETGVMKTSYVIMDKENGEKLWNAQFTDKTVTIDTSKSMYRDSNGITAESQNTRDLK